MIRIHTLIASFLSFLAMASFPALALDNGPLTTNVLGTNYSVYYSLTDYLSVVQNSNNAPDASTKFSTSSPNTLTGLGSNIYFSQPWWNPTNNAAAISAAQTWLNNSNWPINNGVQKPNGGTQSPYFVYATGNGGFFSYYAYVDYSGQTPVVTTGTSSISDTLNYALAAFSN